MLAPNTGNCVDIRPQQNRMRALCRQRPAAPKEKYYGGKKQVNSKLRCLNQEMRVDSIWTAGG